MSEFAIVYLQLNRFCENDLAGEAYQTAETTYVVVHLSLLRVAQK